jgi:hypothetical protein
MTPIFSIRVKTKPKPQNGHWTKFHRDRWLVLTPRLVKSLLTEQRADQDDHAGYARPLAKLILSHPELAATLRPDKGKFHRKIIACVQANPKLTPELRGRLAEYPHICAYLI